MGSKKASLSWSNLFLVTFLVAYLFIFNEWLFAITKPSYMNDLGFTHQLQIFLSTSALLASLCFLCLLPLVILSLVPSFKRYTGMLTKLGSWLPAVIGATLILFLVDNFTYTVFKFGIVSTEGWNRGLYGLGFILVIILCYRRTLNVLVILSQRTRDWGFAPKWIFSLLSGVLLLSIATLVFFDRNRALSLPSASQGGATLRPHILLITANGVDASHTSAYGYERDTTPRLRELAESSLVAENAFSNAGNTTGSVISIYTGKYPAKTRVIYPPDILRGADAYEHLPGILRSQGYRTVQITLPYYLDPGERNILDGFDAVTTNRGENSKYLKTIRKVLPNENALFTDEILNRIVDRVRHIFFIMKMTNPYLLVTGLTEPLEDTARLDTLQYEIQSSRGPIFVHAHMMGTHGELYNPAEQIFSAGQNIQDQEPWNVDFYDDSILAFDRQVGELVDTLTDLGLLEDTLLIIGSDHGQKFQLNRVPLIIRFPRGQYADRIRANVQNLDIAPTVLDFIGFEQPGWMRGASLIAGELEQRPIFSVNEAVRERDPSGFPTVNWEKVGPPFYQFDAITLFHCQKWFKLDLTELGWESGNVEDSTSACPPGSELTDGQAFQWIVEHLKENNFDVSTLDHFSP